MYKGHYLGYNFGAKIFIRHDTIYSLGGYGYWKLQSNLLRFDRSKGSWEMVPTVQEPQDYGSYCMGIKGDPLFSLFGERRRENSGFRAHAKTGFYLNLKTLKWKKIYYKKQTGPGSYLPIGSWYIDLKDYLIFEQARGLQLGIYIINKNNFTISYWDRNEYSMNLSPFVFVKGDALIYQKKQTGLVVLNFDKIKGGETFLGKMQWHHPIVNYVLDAGLLAIIALILGFWIWKYKNPRQDKINGEAEKDLIEYLTDKILKLKGEILDTAIIDQLLEIDHLPYETRRSKRAALIKEINARYKRTKGTNLIARRKYEADKRYIQYVIG